MTYLLPPHWETQPLTQIAHLAPVEEVNWPLARAHNIAVAIKREDKLHPSLGGNKFYKLHFHLKKFLAANKPQLLTFGGAYSNHICATAAAGAALEIPTIGVIRGERPATLNSMLINAQQQGMRLHFVTRADYLQKSTAHFHQKLQDLYGEFYFVPEGAGDLLGAKGCAVWTTAALELCPWTPTHLAVACGTGGTLAGVWAAAPASSAVHGFLAIKGSESEHTKFFDNVLTLGKSLTSKSELLNATAPCLTLETNYHCGGYAKFPSYLQDFAQQFSAQTDIPLDRVYTAKLFWGLQQKMLAGEIAEGAKILVLHTGGLQTAG